MEVASYETLGVVPNVHDVDVDAGVGTKPGIRQLG